MKKLILTFCAALAVFSASAAFDGTVFYEEDFINMAIDSDVPVDGWLTKGNGLAPYGDIAPIFFKDDDKVLDYVLLTAGQYTYAMANTIYEGGAAADQWLISPEIEVPYDDFAVSFRAVAYCAMGQMKNGQNTFDVYISEGGTEVSDFVKIGSSAVKSDTNIEFYPKDCVFCASGYKGKKVRVAFVTTGADVGFTGFTNISMAQYSVEVANNLTTSFVRPGEQMAVDYNLRMKTPLPCNYVKATLTLENGKTFETRVRKNLYASSITSAIGVVTRITFNNVGVLADGESMNYTLTIEPEFEGAIPVTFTGTINCPVYSYINNVVVEELTATGCTYCPSGIAALEYYADKYKGSETQGKTINIAVHGYVNHPDPMSEGVEEYEQKLKGLTNSGYPAAMFNRGASQLQPTAKAEFEAEIEKASYTYAKINKVEAPVLDLEHDWDVIGREVKVNYSVKNAYKSLNLPLNAAIVLIENGVKGNNSNYAQTNYFANRTASDVTSLYGSWLVPYISKFLSGGELGQSTVPASKMVYEHVARLCYPTFYGTTISEEWNEDEYQTFDMTFKVPENIMDIKNTEVILIITDAESSKIVASDIIPYSEYTKVSEVSEVEAGNISIAKGGNQVEVVAEDGTVVEIYSLDGAKIGNYTVVGGRLDVAPAAGAVIVKASNATETKTAKLLF